MNTFHQIFQSPLVIRLGWTLLHSLWQIAIVSAILVIALRSMRSRDPRWRYSASCVALLTSLILPTITFVVITSNTPSSSPPLAASRINPLTATALSIPPDTTIPYAHRIASVRSESQLITPFPTIAPPQPTPTNTFAAHLLPTARAALPWLVLTWALGILAISIWNLGGWLTLHQLRSHSTASVPISAQRAAQRLCVRFSLSRPVRLLQSTLATTPLVLGAFRPMILLPASVLTDLSIAELESILAHELAHVRRHDYLVNLIQSVVETLLFYHPAIWWISRQIRIEREHCCDDLALTVTRDRATYVTALAAVASVRVPLLAPAASGGKLLPRLRRVLGIPDIESRRSSHWLAGALVTACFALAAIAPHLQSTASAADKTPPATQPAADDIVHVRGRVLDPAGKPLSGANVAAKPAWPRGSDGRHTDVISRAVTGNDGRFEISFNKSAASAFALGYGQDGHDLWKKLQIVATAAGLGMDWAVFDHVDAAGDLVLQLAADLPINGRIIDLEGRPVAGVTVTVGGLSSHILTDITQFQHPPENERGIEMPIAGTAQDIPVVSDADGRFQIVGLGRDRLANLKFRSNQIALLDMRVMTRTGNPIVRQIGSDPNWKSTYYANTFEIAAAPARTISGTVSDAQTHQLIPHAKVATSYSTIDRETFTDERGRYRLEGLDRGRSIEITVTSDGQPYIPAIFGVAPKGAADKGEINVDLVKGIWITGKVTESQTGLPIPAAVYYVPLAINKTAATIPVLREGRAQAPCNTQTQPDGTYRLVGLSGPGIVFVHLPGNATYPLGQGFDAIKAKDKTGRIATFFPGMISPTFYAAAHEIDPASEAPVPGIDFQMSRGGSLHIVCTDPEGKPLKALYVDGNGSGAQTHASIDGSEFDAVGFAPNVSRMIVIRDDARHLGKVVTVRPDDVAAKTLTVKLEPMATVTGRLLTPDKDPIKSGRLRIDSYVPELRQANRSSIADGYSEPDGRFTIWLSPGCRCSFGASPNPGGGRFKEVTIDLDLKPGATKALGDIELTLQSMK